jgi:serpin B
MRTRRLVVLPIIVVAGSVAAVVFVRGWPRASSDHTLVVRANNQFAIDLYQRLRSGRDNLFFSPYSVFMALGMTYAGARGATQEQTAQAMSLPTSTEALRRRGITREPLAPTAFARECGSLIKNLNAGGKAGRYELNVANALWGQRNYTFVPDFIKLAETEYGGKLQRLDFAQPAQAAATINAWVEEQTKDKITNLISAEALGPLTRLVLTNAIYFKGKWVHPFWENGTMRGSFNLPGGSSRQALMMNIHETLGYADSNDLQILDLEYVGKDLSMTILLPRQTDGITRLEGSLTCKDLSGWLSSIRRVEVKARVPRFKATSSLSLIPALKSLGMIDAFSFPAADFSGMTNEPNVYVSEAVHKAYVDMNEKGTEAAAATGVAGETVSRGDEPKYRTFIADHPFIYLIRERQSGAILFLGRMMDPVP